MNDPERSSLLLGLSKGLRSGCEGLAVRVEVGVGKGLHQGADVSLSTPDSYFTSLSTPDSYFRDPALDSTTIRGLGLGLGPINL